MLAVSRVLAVSRGLVGPVLAVSRGLVFLRYVMFLRLRRTSLLLALLRSLCKTQASINSLPIAAFMRHSGVVFTASGSCCLGHVSGMTRQASPLTITTMQGCHPSRHPESALQYFTSRLKLGELAHCALISRSTSVLVLAGPSNKNLRQWARIHRTAITLFPRRPPFTD